MPRIHLLLFITLLILTISVKAQQTLATIEVQIPTEQLASSRPLKIAVDPITFLPDSLLALVEVRGNKTITVNTQINYEPQRTLYWTIEPVKNLKKRIFKLQQNFQINPRVKTSKVTVVDKDGAIIIQSKQKNLLQYNYETVYPPAGADSAFKRSAFIHPLWSPKGQVLTRIQPPDHYHHYGIWNPWTHILYEGDTLDFWNLNKKQGTVKFANFNTIKSGDVFGEYQTLHQHTAFRNNGEEVIINETQTVRIYQSSGHENYYITDITIAMNCPAKPVLLLEYRYGGLGWRTTEQWTKDNSEVMTSEGKTRKDADGTKARWCMVQGLVDADTAGVLMMSYPTNYNHPEPLRIWPENQYDRGDMFANFDPTKDMDWLLEPGNDYVLKYRLIVFNGKWNKKIAENAWRNFTDTPVITITKN
jgi:hypothetical protein